MLVVRDLSGTVDTEAELARSQRQTEMILRAAAEGVVGTDTDGRVVLVNPAAAQILGFRASDLGGQELHPLILHSRADGEPFPYEESPLADTLSPGASTGCAGRCCGPRAAHQVPVDLTTAPVRDGDQLVGAVMTFTDRGRTRNSPSSRHAERSVTGSSTETPSSHRGAHRAHRTAHRRSSPSSPSGTTTELADRTRAVRGTRWSRAGRPDTDLTARHDQLTAVLGESLRGPLEELRGELSKLAADPAGQLWPEANQILHHLAAGYCPHDDARRQRARLPAAGQRRGAADQGRTCCSTAVVTAGVDGAVELIGPGRAQFAVHAPPIEAEVDAGRLATALAHLVADVAGVDSTGKARVVPGGGYVDSTVVVAAAQRGEVVRIEVRGPFAGGDPVHEPIVRGIVRAHGGVLQTHEMPGMSGSAYVLEVPLGAGSGTVMPPEPPVVQAPAEATAGGVAGAGAVQEQPGTPPGGRRRARRASTDAFLESPVGAAEAGPGAGPGAVEPTGRRRARREAVTQEEPAQQVTAAGSAVASGARPRPAAGRGIRPQAGEAQPGRGDRCGAVVAARTVHPVSAAGAGARAGVGSARCRGPVRGLRGDGGRGRAGRWRPSAARADRAAAGCSGRDADAGACGRTPHSSGQRESAGPPGSRSCRRPGAERGRPAAGARPSRSRPGGGPGGRSGPRRTGPFRPSRRGRGPRSRSRPPRPTGSRPRPVRRTPRCPDAMTPYGPRTDDDHTPPQAHPAPTRPPPGPSGRRTAAAGTAGAPAAADAARAARAARGLGGDRHLGTGAGLPRHPPATTRTGPERVTPPTPPAPPTPPV